MARVNGQAYRRVKETFRAQSQSANTPCWICLQPIDYDAASDDWGNDDRFQPDHYYPVSTHPPLTRARSPKTPRGEQTIRSGERAARRWL